MVAIIVSLYALGAILPMVGLVRFARAARRELTEAQAETPEQAAPMIAFGNANDKQFFSLGDLTRAGRAIRTAPFTNWRRAKIDLILIGVGLVAGAGASIWSLFLG